MINFLSLTLIDPSVVSCYFDTTQLKLSSLIYRAELVSVCCFHTAHFAQYRKQKLERNSQIVHDARFLSRFYIFQILMPKYFARAKRFPAEFENYV